ncbi:MAG: DUF3419 family protein [Bacteroidia bacterium]
MSDNLTTRVNFELIRYANCWEDADILLEGLEPKEGSKILSIASAGDNSFSLLAANPEMVVAVDINKIQLYLVALKKVCIKNLDREDVLNFLGFSASTERERLFHLLKSELSADAKNYWEKNIQLINAGLINQGKFEKYFQMFCNRILPWIHSKKTIDELFRNKTNDQQTSFYNEKWDTWRWRMLFRIFFSKYIMGKYGRDPEFLKEVEVSVSDYIYKKAGEHLQSQAAQENLFLHYNLKGNFGALLPHYLQPHNFKIIKSNINRLNIKEGYAQDAIGESGKFHCMNLSNIFEYMNKELFSETAQALTDGMEKNGRFAYWNLMVPRKISDILPGKVKHEQELSLVLMKKDKGFFYSRFIIDQIK